MNRLSDNTGASSGNNAPSVLQQTKDKSSRNSGSDELSAFMQGFKDVIFESSKDAAMAANRRHAENKEDNERCHKEAQEAEDNSVKMKVHAAVNRVILQASLDHKGYLKRRIDTLQDEARKNRFKIFQSADSSKAREEAFYRSELVILQEEIVKCNNELENE